MWQNTIMATFVLTATINIVKGKNPCCSPNQITAQAYQDGVKLWTDYIDFTKEMVLEDFDGQKNMHYILTDLKNQQVYVRWTNATCSKYPMVADRYHQCMPSDAVPFDIPTGDDGVLLEGYQYQVGSRIINHVVTSEKCLTRFTNTTTDNINYHSYWFRNVVPTVYDESVFKKDVSDCYE